MSITGTRLTMISLYTLQRFAHFSPQDSIASAWFSHCMMFEKRMTETQSFRNNHSLLWMDRYTYFPLHLLVYHWKSSHNLINYARAHNSLWLHTEVSSMNHLSSLWAWVAVHRKITQVLRDFQKIQATLGSQGTSIHPNMNLSCHLK